MLWVGTEHWDLFVGQAQLAWARQGAAPVWSTYEDLHQRLAEVMNGIRQQRAGWQKPRVRVWLSGAMARPFVLTKPQGIKSDAELKTVAAAQAELATGLPGPPVVWLSDASKGESVLAVAAQLAVRDELLRAARQAGVRLQSLRPLWARTLSEVLHANAEVQLLAAEDPEALTVLVSRGDNWATADSYSPRPEKAQQAALVARRMIAANVPAAAAVTASAAAGSASTSAGHWLTAQIDQPALQP